MSGKLKTTLWRCLALLVGVCVLAAPLMSSAVLSAFAEDSTTTTTTTDAAAGDTSTGDAAANDVSGSAGTQPTGDQTAADQAAGAQAADAADAADTTDAQSTSDQTADDLVTYANELSLPSGDAANAPTFDNGGSQKGGLVNGLTPRGTTIDLFDYWLTGQTDADNADPWNRETNQTFTSGINNGHALLFSASGDSRLGSWNHWTGNERPETGIVQSSLGSDGYPQLNPDKVDTSSLHLTNQDGWSRPNALQGRDNAESLAYLFQPNTSNEGKASYPNVQNLLQVDSEGYYYYDSTQNYAVYYPDSNSFALYDSPGVRKDGSGKFSGQFFPFNAVAQGEQTGGGDSYLVKDTVSTNSSLNHYFGVHMSTHFIQEKGGHNGGNEVTYHFSGDDDVWIFIDGTLVADLGGVHNAASVDINFATGAIVINSNYAHPTYLADVLGYEDTKTNTLPDDTYHKLDFFYLERGNADSNMTLKYNLVSIPESDLIKVDQIGNPIAGATFSLYDASAYADGNTAEPIATGTTDGSGQFVFVKSKDKKPITIQELYETYKNSKDKNGNNLILAETKTPDGYRTNGPIGLYFYDDTANDEVLLLSNNTWDKGAYAMPKVTTTATNRIYSVDGTDYADLNGPSDLDTPVMFAVVFQKQNSADAGTSDAEWRPISGDPVKGWTVQKGNSWTDILAAAKAKPYQFQISSDGAYQVEVSNLPGNITDYYYVKSNATKPSAKYTIAYFYTSADSIADATDNNTWRIDTERMYNDATFSRVFSMNLYVTNIKNYLMVQKVDDEGTALTGAEFTLYRVPEPEENAPEGAKTITVDDVTAYEYDSLTTSNIGDADGGGLQLNGGGVFPTTGNVLKKGEYYLVETKAPPADTPGSSTISYEQNETATHIVVDDTGVYADAGTDMDGVSVLRGVGSIMRSMVQFAAEDNVDITLNRIKAALVTSNSYDGTSTHWSNADWNTGALHLDFDNDSAMLDYGPVNAGGSLVLSTDAGWSKLLVRQDGSNAKYPVDYTDLGEQDITNLFSGTVTVRVVNNRIGVTDDLKISKIVAGTMGDRDKVFDFTITLIGSDVCPTPESGDTCKYSYTRSVVDGVNGATAPNEGTLPFKAVEDADNTYTSSFTLKHGQSITINDLPASVIYEISEPNAESEGYTVSAKQDDSAETSTTARAGESSDTYSAMLSTVKAVTFTNTRDGSIPTGLQAADKSWLWIAGIAGIGGAVVIAASNRSDRKRCGGRHVR